MYLLLQQDKSDDCVLATGATTTVRQAFGYIGISVKFAGTGVTEQVVVKAIDETLFSEKFGALCSLKFGQTRVGG